MDSATERRHKHKKKHKKHKHHRQSDSEKPTEERDGCRRDSDYKRNVTGHLIKGFTKALNKGRGFSKNSNFK